jgi:hypothetical protein
MFLPGFLLEEAFAFLNRVQRRGSPTGITERKRGQKPPVLQAESGALTAHGVKALPQSEGALDGFAAEDFRRGGA